MRLWHYKLIKFIPKSQLLAQWRELNSIFKKKDNHILINYAYEYPDENLVAYANIVLEEMDKRHIRVRSFDNYINLVCVTEPRSVDALMGCNPFKKHHDDRYLLQCFFNLQEKYDRGQKDFSKEEYERLESFVMKEATRWHSR